MPVCWGAVRKQRGKKKIEKEKKSSVFRVAPAQLTERLEEAKKMDIALYYRTRIFFCIALHLY